MRDGAVISGATGATFTLPFIGDSHEISVKITVSKSEPGWACRALHLIVGTTFQGRAMVMTTGQLLTAESAPDEFASQLALAFFAN